jgi:hypothetical protein
MPAIDYTGRDPQTGHMLPGNRLAVGAGGNPNSRKIADLNRAFLGCGTPEIVAELFGLQLKAAREGDGHAREWLLNKLTGRATQAVEVSTADEKTIRLEANNTLGVILAVLKSHPEASYAVSEALQRATARPMGAIDGPGNRSDAAS